jgi:uncharacterized protein (DUF983 family)
VTAMGRKAYHCRACHAELVSASAVCCSSILSLPSLLTIFTLMLFFFFAAFFANMCFLSPILQNSFIWRPFLTLFYIYKSQKFKKAVKAGVKRRK